MANYKVEISGINTNDITVLKNSEMIELFKRYQEGDLFAKDLLINGNLKLVLSILKKYKLQLYMFSLALFIISMSKSLSILCLLSLS